MNIRVVSLLVVTALYARMWAGDNAYQREQLAAAKIPFETTTPRTSDLRGDIAGTIASCRNAEQRGKAGDGFRGCLGPGAGGPHFEISRQKASTTPPGDGSDEIPMNTLWMFGNCEMSLPRDITPGRYRVVNNRGDVRVVELSDEELEYHGILAGALPRDIYTVSEGRMHWYFVRIEPQTTRLWIAGKASGLRFSLRTKLGTNYAAVSGYVREHFPQWIAEIGRSIATAEAQQRNGDDLSRGWTWQRWLQLRKQWNALLRQVQMGIDATRKAALSTHQQKDQPSRVSSGGAQRGLR